MPGQRLGELCKRLLRLELGPRSQRAGAQGEVRMANEHIRVGALLRADSLAHGAPPERAVE